ncbi:MAG: MBL fold metallo-hydrolase [Alphaproteobacteria bacterium]
MTGGRVSKRVPALLAVLALLCAAVAARAACLPIASAPARFIPAAATDLTPGEVEITFLGHASFLIRSPEGATAVTDYNGVHKAPFAPDIVTMNNAHATHFTDDIEEGVRYVLRGWADAEDQPPGPARHDLAWRDMRVWNIPTNVRQWGDHVRPAGNSIFVFEVSGLCIAHLGHLHHRLTDDHLAYMGIIDVLLVPVDGGYTLAQPLMLEVVRQIRPSVVIPMHYFGMHTLERFLAMLAEDYEIELRETPEIVLARATLPHRKAIVLPGY